MSLEEAVKSAIVKSSTRCDYLITIKQFSKFCRKELLPDLSYKSVTLFLGWLKDGEERLSTIKKKKRHLNTLLNTAQPGKNFSIPKIAATENKVKKYVLSPEEFEELVEEAKKEKGMTLQC